MRRHVALLLLLGLLAAAPACQTPGARGRAGAGATGDAAGGGETPAEGESRPAEAGASATAEARPTAETDPGPYAGDERFAALASTWSERVAGAADRLALSTGLGPRAAAPPRVVLCALGDERLPWRLEHDIVEGKRRSVVRVNAEPLVVGRADPDRTLVRALAATAVEDRPGAPAAPAWFPVYVGVLAAGDLADRVEAATRAAAGAGKRLDVDPADPADAEATALGAALLLAERSTPLDVRRFVALVADGEDPDRLIPRWIQDPSAPWAGAAREILEDAASRVPLDGDRALAAARKALETLGPAGMEASLAASEREGALTAADGPEADALRLSAAVRGGDEAAARAVLARTPAEAPRLGHMADPGAYVLLAARVETLPGGDPMRAWALLSRFDRDFPKHPARAEAFDEMVRLLPRLSSDVEARVLARVLAERGPSGLPADVVARRVRALLDDHRPGAAGRFLDGLGARADAGDLTSVRADVLMAATDPSPASRESNRERAQAWVRDPSASTAADVVDGGMVAAESLAASLPGLPAGRRAAAVRLLVEAAGFARAAGLLAPSWATDPDRLGEDLDVLASEAGYADLRRTVEALHPAVRTEPRAAAEWERIGLGLDPEVLAADDGLLARLHSPEFTVRRDAFQEVAARRPPVVTPALLGHFAKDSSILLRRLAVLAAGRAGQGAVARDALSDSSWIVRQAACAAVADAGWAEAAPDVAALLTRPDPDPRVREAAAAAMLRLAAVEPRWVRPVVSILRLGDPALADDVAAALPDLPAAAVARALSAELALEVLGPAPRADPTVLFRLFVAYRRAAGRDPGYDPSLSPEQVRALVAGLPENRGAR